MIGIYKITNNTNGKVYIGQSIDIYKRWREHKRRAFIKNEEYNKYLYNAFRKYGIDNFTFEIIELCNREDLNNRECYYIQFYNSNNEQYGYNETSGYDNPSYGQSGEQHHNHKLTAEEVYYIRECYNRHYSKEEVYEEFSDRLSKSGFHKIWLGNNWREIHMDVYTEENHQYYLFQRNSHPGVTNGRAKLTEEMVRDIRTRRKNGENLSNVYELYKSTGITKGSFTQVWCNKNWKDIIV